MLVPIFRLEAGDEIVDLTCESLEPVVVDLTRNDSVVVSCGAAVLSVIPGLCSFVHRPSWGHLVAPPLSVVGSWGVVEWAQEM